MVRRPCTTCSIGSSMVMPASGVAVLVSKPSQRLARGFSEYSCSALQESGERSGRRFWLIIARRNIQHRRAVQRTVQGNGLGQSVGHGHRDRAKRISVNLHRQLTHLREPAVRISNRQPNLCGAFDSFNTANGIVRGHCGSLRWSLIDHYILKRRKQCHSLGARSSATYVVIRTH